jgi:hypothetical protein
MAGNPITGILPLLGGGAAAPVIGAGVGIAQLLQGMSQNKKADQMYPTVPPIYRLLQQDYQRKMRNAETGSMYNALLNKARQSLSTGSQSILQTGNPMAYNFAQRKAAEGINELLATVSKERQGYEGMNYTAADQSAKMGFQLASNKWANMATRGQQNTQQGIDNLLKAGSYNRINTQGNPTMNGNNLFPKWGSLPAQSFTPSSNVPSVPTPYGTPTDLTSNGNDWWNNLPIK